MQKTRAHRPCMCSLRSWCRYPPPCPPTAPATPPQHPNIVKCFRSFLSEADNELVIVLEWAEAGDLGQLIKQRAEAGQPFSEEQVWRQFQQVSRGGGAGAET